MRMDRRNEWLDFKRKEKRNTDKDKLGRELKRIAYGALAVKLIAWAVGYFGTFSLNESVITFAFLFMVLFVAGGMWVAGWIVQKIWRRL